VTTRWNALVDHVHRFDDAADASLDHLRGTPALDKVMYAASEVADFSVLWHLIGITKGVFGNKRSVDAAYRLSAILGVESLLVNGLIKRLFRRQRPTHDAERPLPLRQPLTSSFPSGHASAAFTAATVLADASPLAVKPAWYALAAVVASSRVYVKIHHASDVVAGAVLGLALGRLARLLGTSFPFGR
jgi:membrane-associated phospholipid phosphatase